MGLYIVELIMAIEEHFKMRIEDEEAEKLITPQHLADYIHEKVGGLSDGPCANLVNFNVLRKSLCGNFQLPRNSIKPDTKLSVLFKDDIRDKWTKLRKSLPSGSLPELQRSWPLLFTCVFLAPSVGALLTYMLSNSLLYAIPAFYVVLIIAHLATKPLANIIPEDFDEVQRIVKFMPCSNQALGLGMKFWKL